MRLCPSLSRVVALTPIHQLVALDASEHQISLQLACAASSKGLRHVVAVGVVGNAHVLGVFLEKLVGVRAAWRVQNLAIIIHVLIHDIGHERVVL